MVGILCGPVVGHVTSTSAIVLIEIDEHTAVQGTLKEVKSGRKVMVEKQVEARKPTIFKFENLSSNTKYQFYVGGSSDDILAEFVTFPEDITSMNIAVVSCDRPKFDVKVSMWDQLKARISRDSIHLVLHVGDNVYLDEVLPGMTNEEIVNSDKLFNPDKIDQSTPYVQARSLLRDLPRREWASKTDEIVEIYRNKYREVWRMSNRAYILSHASNLMILDDHEIRDDIGGVQPDDSDPESKEYFLASLAVQVYHEYQRQLWDTDATNLKRKFLNEFYVIQLGGIGIMMLDVRTTKSVYKPFRAPGDDSYYGKEQFEEIRKNLQNTNNGVSLWLIVTGLPLMFLKRKINRIAGRFADDLSAHINLHHQKDLVPILQDIKTFKEQRSTSGLSGDVLILCGDVHLGGFTDVYFKDENTSGLVCRQICSSAIHNNEFRLIEYAKIRTLLSFTEEYGNFSYSHYDWTRKCNFAVLKIKDKSPDMSYTVELVDEDGVNLKDSKIDNWNSGVGGSSCCNIY